MSAASFLTGARSTGCAAGAAFQVVVRPLASCGAPMDEATLQALVRGALDTAGPADISFAWQGEEPMRRGLPFFRQVLALQREHAGQRTVRNTLHTRGPLLDEGWARFLAEAGFGVALQLDAPPPPHAPEAAQLQQALARLQALGVECQTCTAVGALNAHEPLAVYRALKELGARHMQFVPVVELRPGATPSRTGGRALALSPASVGSVAYGRFLTTVFGEWVRHDVGRVFVQLFDSTLQAWVHGRPSLCTFAETCARKVAVEHDGSVYACERCCDAPHRLGTLQAQPLAALLQEARHGAFVAAKRDTLPPQCRRCDVLAACRGGCPQHRFVHAASGGPGVSYLCAGYRHFFRAVAPQVRAMGQLLRQGRPASDIMRFSPR